MTELQIAIPQNAENLMLPSPELVTFYRNLENRTIWVDDEISEFTLEFGRHIMRWNQEDKGKPIEDRTPIKILFHSPGGDLSVNNAMIDIIEMSKTPIYGYNMSEAASSACFIFMACHKRYAMPKSVFLLHKGSGAFSGDFATVIAQVEEYQRQIEELAEFILSHSNIDEKTLMENLGGEWFVTARQAVELGLCDKIITDIDEIL